MKISTSLSTMLLVGFVAGGASVAYAQQYKIPLKPSAEHKKKAVVVGGAAEYENYLSYYNLNSFRREGVKVTTPKYLLAEIIKMLETEAKRGNAISQFYLAQCYENGRGVDKNKKKAFYWYEKAASGGVLQAHLALYYFYKEGKVVNQDLVKALQLLRSYRQKKVDVLLDGYLFAPFDFEILEAKSTPGYRAYDYMITNENARRIGGIPWVWLYDEPLPTPQRTYALLKQEAEAGIILSQFCLGLAYGDGLVCTQDWVLAVYWYKKAAEQGNAQAQYKLGGCYDNGNGVAQDYTKAVYWYQKAAEQGDAQAQCDLGFCYDNGNGVAQDYTKAVYWYQKAAEQGNARAQKALRELVE